MDLMARLLLHVNAGNLMNNIIIRGYKSYYPILSDNAFLADNCAIVGRVIVGGNSSIWYNAVLRGDVAAIQIGRGTNIQDSTVIHVDQVFGDTVIGNMVTVGHSCLLHACTLADFSFVGMGSIVMDRAVVESNAMLAAGSLLSRNKIVRSGELWAGRPAKFLRNLTQDDVAFIKTSAENYMSLATEYRNLEQL